MPLATTVRTSLLQRGQNIFWACTQILVYTFSVIPLRIIYATKISKIDGLKTLRKGTVLAISQNCPDSLSGR